MRECTIRDLFLLEGRREDIFGGEKRVIRELLLCVRRIRIPWPSLER